MHSEFEHTESFNNIAQRASVGFLTYVIIVQVLCQVSDEEKGTRKKSRVGVPEVYFSRRMLEAMSFKPRKIVDLRTAHKNKPYVKKGDIQKKADIELYLAALDSPNLANVITLLCVL